MTNLKPTTLSFSTDDVDESIQPPERNVVDNVLSKVGLKRSSFVEKETCYRIQMSRQFEGMNWADMPTTKDFEEYFDNPPENSLAMMIDNKFGGNRLAEGITKFGNTIADVSWGEKNVWYVHVKPMKNCITKFKDYWNNKTGLADIVGRNITRDGFILEVKDTYNDR